MLCSHRVNIPNPNPTLHQCNSNPTPNLNPNLNPDSTPTPIIVLCLQDEDEDVHISKIQPKDTEASAVEEAAVLPDSPVRLRGKQAFLEDLRLDSDAVLRVRTTRGQRMIGFGVDSQHRDTAAQRAEEILEQTSTASLPHVIQHLTGKCFTKVRPSCCHPSCPPMPPPSRRSPPCPLC